MKSKRLSVLLLRITWKYWWHRGGRKLNETWPVNKTPQSVELLKGSVMGSTPSSQRPVYRCAEACTQMLTSSSTKMGIYSHPLDSSSLSSLPSPSLFLFFRVVETGSHAVRASLWFDVAKDDLECESLPLLPECKDYWRVPPCLGLWSAGHGTQGSPNPRQTLHHLSSVSTSLTHLPPGACQFCLFLQ